jgi:FKBP-type peptidyl-prolyl cis-trans isomerase SlpA
MAKPDTMQRVPLQDLDRSVVEVKSAALSGIQVGTKVTLQFALHLLSGELVDGNFDKPPVSFVVGDGSLLPGFERSLLGHKIGDDINAVVPASQAFGNVNPDNQQRFPRFQFPPDLALSENLFIEFADASGYKQAGRVLSIGSRYVEIDFNHPLAGRDIRFTAKIHQSESTVEPN